MTPSSPRSWASSGSGKSDALGRCSGTRWTFPARALLKPFGSAMMDQSNAARPAGAWALLTHTVSARHGGIVVSAALASIGLLFVWLAARIELGDAALPGPGMFPLALGFIVVALAAGAGVRLWAEAADNEPIELGHRDVLIVFAALLAVP